MSTAGSAPEGGPAKPVAALPPGRKAIFRWKAVSPLAFALLVILGGWALFGDLLVKRAIRSGLTSVTGAEVDVGSVHVGFLTPSLEIRDFAIASTKDSMRNVIAFKRLRIVVAGLPLLEKKVVVRDVSADSMRAMARRATPARRVPPTPPNPFIQAAIKQAQQFTTEFKVEALSLVPIDSVKALVLNPADLQTVQKARALAARADSVKDGLPAKFASLRLAESADSAEALIASLKGQTPRSLGLNGTRTAVNNVRRFVARVDSTKKTFDALQKSVHADADSLVASVKSLDDARQADYDRARAMLKLPTFDAPNIGPSLFGAEAINSFQRIVYWVNLVREYAPPGLLPKKTPGPKRLRMAGTTVHFVKPKGTPRFLLQHAALDLAVDSSAGAVRGAYSFRLADVTTDPSLVGRPTTFSISRNTTGSPLDSLLIVGVIDHTTARQAETIVAKAGGVSLPAFTVPGVPLRLDLGTGAGSLRLDLAGDSLRGHLAVGAPRPLWQPDVTRTKPLNTLESLVVRVLTGIANVDLSADVTGTVKAPKLAVRSNLDHAVADNIKRVAGEEIDRARVKVQAQVDSYVEKETAPVKAKIAETRAEVDRRIADASARLEKAKADLTARLKELSGGLIGG